MGCEGGMMFWMISLLKLAADDGGSTASAGVMGAFFALYMAFIGIFGLLYCAMFLFGIIAFVLWLWMLVDCLSRKDFATENEKLLWALVLVFAGALGAIIYFFVIKRKLDTSGEKTRAA